MAEAPLRLGKYHIHEELGRGGFGTVYRATDTTLDRVVALKILDPLLTRDLGFLERFRREAVGAARLEHPNIVPVYEVGEAEGRSFIAMKFLPGRSLDKLLAEGRLPVERTLHILAQIAAALDFAHGKGLIHRDVKPSNIIVGSDEAAGDQDHATLTDFGLARATDQSMLTSLGQALGTPAYMAPEQLDVDRQDEVGPASDVYGFAVVAYEMLAGRPPFVGPTPAVMAAHLTKEPPPVTQFNSGLPSEVWEALAPALAKQPTARPKSVGQLIDSLQDVFSRAEMQRRLLAEADARRQVRKTQERREGQGFVKWAAIAIIGLVAASAIVMARQCTAPPAPRVVEKIVKETVLVERPAVTVVEKVSIVPVTMLAPATISTSTRATATLTMAPVLPTVTLQPTHAQRSTASATPDLTSKCIAFIGLRGQAYSLWTMNVDGSNARSLQTGDACCPDWSPDGKWIAYREISDGNNHDIYIIRPGGSEKRRLTTDPGWDWAPFWSPDGKRIAFVSNRTGKIETYLMNADGTNQTRLVASASEDWDAVWSPDGSRLAFPSKRSGTFQVWVINADGSGLFKLTSIPGDVWVPSWSPDGKQLVFHVTRAGQSEIWRVNTDGSSPTQITFDGDQNGEPQISPDGRFIIFQSKRRTGRDELYVMNSDGSNQRRITDAAQFEASQPAWCPIGVSGLD